MHLFNPKKRYLNKFSTLASESFSIECDDIKSRDQIPLTLNCIGAFCVDDEQGFLEHFYPKRSTAEEVVASGSKALREVLEEHVGQAEAVPLMADVDTVTSRIRLMTDERIASSGLVLKRLLINHIRDNVGLLELLASAETARVFETKDELEKAEKLWKESIASAEQLPAGCDAARTLMTGYAEFLERAGRAVDATEMRRKLEGL